MNESQNEIDSRFQNTDLNGIGSSFSAQSHKQSSASVKAQTDVQVVDKFFVTRKKAWPLNKLIHEFKLEHAQRFSRTQHNRTSVDRAGSKNTNPLLTRNKSLQKVFPNDTRKYKESSIKELEKQYTFAPNLNPISLQLAKHSATKLNRERSKSRGRYDGSMNQSMALKGSDLDHVSPNQGQARALSGARTRREPDISYERMSTL